MAEAGFVAYIGPVLRALDALGGSGRPNEVAAKVAELLGIDPDEVGTLPVRGTSRFRNQVAWARNDLAPPG